MPQSGSTPPNFLDLPTPAGIQNPPLSNSVSGMHCGIDKSLCILLLENLSLADQTLCLIATPGKGLVKLFPSVVIRQRIWLARLAGHPPPPPPVEKSWMKPWLVQCVLSSCLNPVQCWSSVSSPPASTQCSVGPVCPLLLPQPSAMLVQCVLSSCLNPVQFWSSVSSPPASTQCNVGPVCPLLLPQPSAVLVQCVLSSCLNPVQCWSSASSPPASTQCSVGPVCPLLLPQPSAVLVQCVLSSCLSPVQCWSSVFSSCLNPVWC